MTQTREQIETRMREITDFIGDATQSVREGKMVTLRHLDDEVAALCDAAVSLPPAEAKAVQPRMAEMIGKLEALSDALQAYRTSRGGA